MAHGVVYFDKSPILECIKESLEADNNSYDDYLRDRGMSSDDNDIAKMIKEAPMTYSEPSKIPEE